MKKWLRSPALHIGLIVAAYALLGYRLGVFAVVWSLPLVAALLARPVMALASNTYGRMRGHVWLPVHGQHYVFRGTTLHVVEDDDGQRWVCLADVRRVVPDAANDRTLAATYPGHLKVMGSPAQPHLRDDALVTHLGKQNNSTALKFRTWVARAVMLPGQKTRRNLGIKEAAVEVEDGKH